MSGPRVIGQGGLTAFVPDGDSRKDTAIILVGTARENGLNQRSIRAARGGFYISDELADLLSADDETQQAEQAETQTAEQAEPETQTEEPVAEEPKKTTAKRRSSAKKTSGNRAAKNSTTEEE